MTNTQLTEFDNTLLDLHNSSLLMNELSELTGPGHESHLIINSVLNQNIQSIQKTIQYMVSIKEYL